MLPNPQPKPCSIKTFETRAYTLLELLVVLLLLSLAMALVGPRVASLKPLSPRDFSAQLADLLREGRELSLIRSAYFLVVIDPSQRRVYLADKDLKPLKDPLSIPEEVEIKGEGLLELGSLRGVLFFPGGFSSGGEIEIITPQRSELFRLARAQAYTVRLLTPP